MSVQLIRRLITVREYHIMAESGILTEEDRVELLQGEIVHMSPIGSKHAGCVNRIIELIIPLLNKRASSSAQSPIVLDDFSEPEPDFALLAPHENNYAGKLPEAQDVHLVVEVSDSTLAKDREIKLPLYASAGIPEAWIVNLEKDEIEVHKQPLGDSYKIREICRRGDTIEIKVLDQIVEVSQILGRKE